MSYTIKIILLCFPLYFLIQMVYYNPSHSQKIGYYYTYSPQIFGLSYKRGDLVLFCLNDVILSNEYNQYKHEYNQEQRYFLHLNTLRQLGLPDNIDDSINNCGNKSTYLLKQIVAIVNDKVNVKPEGIYINGKLIANSQSRKFVIHKGVRVDLSPMVYGEFILSKNEYFVMGQTSTSYDSRYFGTIKNQQIYRRAVFILNYNL